MIGNFGMRFFVLMIFISGCALLDQPALENAYLSTAMDNTLLPYASIEALSPRHIELLEDGRGLELSLFPGQSKLNGGIRSEISIDYPFVAGDQVQYQWEIKLPDGFKPDIENRWWIMGQWHDQPDRTMNETWDGFPSHSPSILIAYGHVDGQDYLVLYYGLTQAFIGEIPIDRETWIHLNATITWSQDDDGQILFFVNHADTTTLTASGVNMYNGYQHYFKLGQYRHPDIQLENRIQIRNIEIMHYQAPS